MFSQKETLDLVLAACLAHRLEKLPPVWLALVAAPSSGKTTILDLLPSRALPDPTETLDPGEMVCLDSLTPRTLLSGLQTGDETMPGLLERVKNAVILLKELSTLSTKGRDLTEIMGQLRRAFDGQMSQAWGSGKAFDWQGRLTMIMAGVYHPAELDSELGARMLVVRIGSSATDYQRLLGKKSGKNDYVRDVLSRPVLVPNVKILLTVKPLAETLAGLRGTLKRDRRGWVEERLIEEPHRLCGQLGALAVGLATVWECEPTDAKIIDTLWRVVGDSQPPRRLTALRVLARGAVERETAAKRLATQHPCSDGYANETLKDLALLGIVHEHPVRTGKRGRPKLVLNIKPEWKEQVSNSLV